MHLVNDFAVPFHQYFEVFACPDGSSARARAVFCLILICCCKYVSCLFLRLSSFIFLFCRLCAWRTSVRHILGLGHVGWDNEGRLHSPPIEEKDPWEGDNLLVSTLSFHHASRARSVQSRWEADVGRERSKVSCISKENATSQQMQMFKCSKEICLARHVLRYLSDTFRFPTADWSELHLFRNPDDNDGQDTSAADMLPESLQC